MKHINWKFNVVALFMLLFTYSGDLFASHIVGGEINYTCVGGNVYEIELRVFRDCFFGDQDAQFDDPAFVGIYIQNIPGIFRQISIPRTVDDTLTNSVSNPCLVLPPTVCVHTTTYRTRVTLPVNPNGYWMVYQRCCRNQTVQNIINPLNAGATYSIFLSETAQRTCNSSPEFQEYPPVGICVDKPIDWDHSALETDGDSLYYRLCRPLVGGTFNNAQPIPPSGPPFDSIFWAPNFNLNQVLGISNPANRLRIDPNTGLLSGVPEMLGQFVVGICVEEYRNGERLSVVRRDFQYNVLPCDSVASAFFIPEVQCDDLTVNFDNQSTVADSYEWYFDYPNNPNIGSTELAPSFTYPDTGTYTVMLIAQPNSVCADTSFETIFLQFNSLTANFQTEVFNCQDSAVVTLVDASTDFVSPVVGWSWIISYGATTLSSNQQNPTFIVPTGISGTISLTATSRNGCEQTFSQPFNSQGANPGASIRENWQICRGETIELNSAPGAFPSAIYNWAPGFANPADDNQTITPLVSSTYRVTISAPNGRCETVKTIRVDVVPPPSLDFTFGLDCDGQSVTFTNNSQNANNYVWNFGDPANPNATSTQPNPIYEYPGPGTYTVTLSNTNPDLCLDTITQQITLVNNSVQADFAVSYNNCALGSVDVQLTDLTANSLNNTSSWEWTVAGVGIFTTQNPSFSVTQSGNYAINLNVRTDDGCTSNITETVFIEVVQDILADSIQICQGGSAQLNPMPFTGFQYNWSPSTGLNDPTVANPIATPSATTTYTVTLFSISADTCRVDESVVAFVPPALNLTANNITDCTPNATLTATATGNVTYEWTNAGGTAVGMMNTLDVPLSGASTYQVRATDQFGCSETTTVQANGGPVNLVVSPDQVICSDQPLAVNANNQDGNDQLTYLWSSPTLTPNSPNAASTTLTPIPGIHEVYLNTETQFGCTQQDTVEVVVIDANISLDFDFVVLCDGKSVQFTNTSSNAFGYQWTFGDPNNPLGTSTDENPMFTFPTLGTYPVTLDLIYDADCVVPSVQSIEIIEETLSADFDFFYSACSASSIEVTFTDATFNSQGNTTNWTWNISGQPQVTGTPTTTVTITSDQTLFVELVVGNAVDCISSFRDTLVIDLTENNLPESILRCFGDSVQLNPNGDPSYQYFWTPNIDIDDQNAANPTVFPSITTNYLVQITNISADTCIITDNVEVVVPAQLQLTNTSDTIVCDEQINLTATTIPASTITWLDASGTQIGSGSPFLYTPQGQNTLTVVATDSNGCSVQDTLQVTEGAVNIMTDQTNIITCPQDSLVLEIDNLDPNDQLIWTWTAIGGGTFIRNRNTGTPTVTAPMGVSTFTGSAVNQFGCSEEITIRVEITNFMPVVDPSPRLCNGASTELNPNANSTYVYQWSPPIGLNSTTIGNPTATLFDTFTYTVVVQDTSRAVVCSDTIEVTAQVNPELDLTALRDTVLCDPVPLDLQAISPVTGLEYDWFNATDPFTPIGMNATLTVNEPGTQTYIIIAEDDLGCLDTADVTVQTFIIDAELPDSINYCAGTGIEIGLINNAADQTLSNFVWTPAESIIENGNTANPTFEFTASTTVSVTFTNQVGCTATRTTFVTFFDPEMRVDVTATPDTILLGAPNGSQLDATLIDGFIYSWSPCETLDDCNSPTPIANPTETTEYILTIENLVGCITSRSVTVTVIDPLCADPFIFVPDAFTPNGDGMNDVLFVRGQAIDQLEFSIYNRWGQLMFETTDPTIGWDGTFKGEPLPPDAFGYYLRVSCFNGEEFFEKGNVSILK